MRYIVTLSDGTTFTTDFEDAGIVGGAVQALSTRSKLVICKRATNAARPNQPDVWHTYGPPHGRYLNPAHIVTILDNDCG